MLFRNGTIMKNQRSFLFDLADLLAKEITGIFKYNPELKNEQFYLDLTRLAALQKTISKNNQKVDELFITQVTYVSQYLLSKFQFPCLGTRINIINTEHPKYSVLCTFIGCLLIYHINKYTGTADEFIYALLPEYTIH